MSRCSVGGCLFVGLLGVSAAAASDRATRTMSLAEVRPILAAVGDSAPPALRDPAGADADATWSAWVRQREADIRARIARGDEDSVVNLMLYGTRFTRWPRATPDALAGSSPDARLDRVMDGRVADLAAAIESPAGDARLQFVRQVVERHGIVVGAPSREATRRHLIELRSRVLSENERYLGRRADAESADASQQRAIHATLYRDRGLSSDSSWHVDFALEQALAAIRDGGELTRRPVERVAVIGPGLDFVDKAQGYDFYPEQMIQPFAVAESLRRLGVAPRPTVTAFDISPRVIAHLRHARERAGRRQPYRLNVLLEQDRGSRLDPALVEYWRRFGEHLGTRVVAEVPAEYAGQVRVRAVDVRPEIVLDVRGVELNVVFERPSSAGATNLFDLLVATNVLVYYDSFEQALAVSNMAGMLRAGGLLLTNQPVPLPTAWSLSPLFIMSVAFDRLGSHQRGDAIYVYRKV